MLKKLQMIGFAKTARPHALFLSSQNGIYRMKKLNITAASIDRRYHGQGPKTFRSEAVFGFFIKYR